MTDEFCNIRLLENAITTYYINKQFDEIIWKKQMADKREFIKLPIEFLYNFGNEIENRRAKIPDEI